MARLGDQPIPWFIFQYIHPVLWFSLYRMKTLWILIAWLEPQLHRWSGSTGCSIAVGSCWRETLGEAGTLPPMAFPTKVPWKLTPPHTELVGSGEQCLHVMGPTNRSMKPSAKATRATPSALPSTACWPSSPWICSSSSTGQISTWTQNTYKHTHNTYSLWRWWLFLKEHSVVRAGMCFFRQPFIVLLWWFTLPTYMFQIPLDFNDSG